MKTSEQIQLEQHPNYPRFTNHIGDTPKGCVEIKQEYGISKNKYNSNSQLIPIRDGKVQAHEFVIVFEIRVVGATVKSRKKAAMKLLKGINNWIRKSPMDWLIKDSNFKVLTQTGFDKYLIKKQEEQK